MDYVYVVYYSDGADDDDIVGDIVELVAAYQYEEDALAYIARSRSLDRRAIDRRLAQYLRIEKVVFKV